MTPEGPGRALLPRSPAARWAKRAVEARGRAYLPAATSPPQGTDADQPRHGKVHRVGAGPRRSAGFRSAPRRPDAAPAESPAGSHWGQAFPF